MEDTNKAEFELQVSITDATDEELDRFTRQLLTEVRYTNVETAELLKEGTAPEGTMSGDVVTIGSIAIVVLPAVLPSIIALVQAWIMRGQGRTVKFKGKGVEFEGSPEELQKLLATFEKGKKKK